MPGTQESHYKGCDYNGNNLEVSYLGNLIQEYQPSHPTIIQLLTLHARNIQEGAGYFEMLDKETQSWAKCEFVIPCYGSLAPLVYWNVSYSQMHGVGYNQVFVSWLDPDRRDDYLGSRPAVG